MLTIFKSINNGTQVAEWQQAFSQKYQGVDFGNNWGWSNIEKQHFKYHLCCFVGIIMHVKFLNQILIKVLLLNKL
jgi:hypothetical protein